MSNIKGKKRSVLVGLATVVLITPAAAIGAGAIASGPASAATGSSSTSTTKVVRTNLAETVQVSGSIGYDGNYSIVASPGTSAQALTQAQNAVASAQAALTNDQVSASDTAASNNQALAQAQAAVNTAQAALTNDQAKQAADCAGPKAGSQPCSADAQTVAHDQAQLAQAETALNSAQLNATRASHQDQAKQTQDTMQLQNAQAALATAQRTATNPGMIYTAVPGLGQVITQGQQVYATDGRQVPLFYGTVTPWRAFALGMSDGADVGELTQNLIALGYGSGLTQSNHFSQATADAVKRWQAALGVEQTGAIRMNEVVFAPGPIRVSAVHATVGGAASGGPILDATSTNRIVTVQLSVSQEYLVHSGDAVSIVLPDGKTTTGGHVRDISTVATAPSGSNNGSTPTVAVTITLDDPGSSGRLDQAPVNVNITDQSVHGVLAVPINALLTLSEGGDAVEVVDGGTRHLVAVQTGLFSSTMVEISGQGITEGTVVEVPSS
jgi:multidrug efflux pump subunit AcrA (membrane-fusion protein)